MEKFPFKNFSLTIPSSFTDFYNFISPIFLFSFIAIFAFTAKINQYYLADPFPWLFPLISPLQKILLSSMEIPQLDCSSPISILSLHPTHFLTPRFKGINQHERLGLSGKKLIIRLASNIKNFLFRITCHITKLPLLRLLTRQIDEFSLQEEERHHFWQPS